MTKEKRLRVTPHHVSGTRKRKLIADSRLLYLQLWPDAPVKAACLYHAAALKALAAKRFGLELMLQAGTSFWPRIREDEDDGQRPTRFGYEWCGLEDEVTKHMLAIGALPELHCWLGEVETNSIIDPTTSTWPGRAKDCGLTWTAKRPPAFVWREVEAFEAEQAKKPKPFRAIYRVNREATFTASDICAAKIYPRIAHALSLDAIRD